MENEKIDQMVQDLMNEVHFKITMQEVFTIMIAWAFIVQCKQKRPDLLPAARKKALDTIKTLGCYQSYMNHLAANN